MAAVKFITVGLVVALFSFCLAMANTELLEPADINNAEEYMEHLTRLLGSASKRFDIPKIRRSDTPIQPRVAGLWPWLMARHAKRNAELINSLLGLPRFMKTVG